MAKPLNPLRQWRDRWPDALWIDDPELEAYVPVQFPLDEDSWWMANPTTRGLLWDMVAVAMEDLSYG